MRRIKMLDRFFERGFFSFVSLTVFTLLLCNLLYTSISKYIDHRYEENKLRSKNVSFLHDTTKIIIWGAGLVIILSQIKPLKPLGDTLLGAGGILAIGTSIAAQTTFGNYISGFFLAIHQPFKVGDIVYLKEKGVSGTVKEITMRHTTIETKTGSLLTIPNTVMNTAMIEDLSDPGYTRPIEFKVANSTDLDKLNMIIKDVLSDNILAVQKDVRISVENFDGVSYTVSVPLCAGTLNDYEILRNSVIPELNKALKKHKINVI